MSKAVKSAKEPIHSTFSQSLLNLAQHSSLRWSLGVFVVLIAMMYVAKPIDDPDTWWHLKTGQLISQTGEIPKTDSFSYLLKGKHWIVHEWLSQLTFWKSWKAGGAYGLFLFREGFAALLFGLLFLWGASMPFASAALILFGVTFMGFGFVERPQLFSYFFVLSYRWILPKFCASSGGKKWLWAGVLFVSQALWANFHGAASIVGIVMAGAYAGGFFVSGARRDSGRTALLALGAALSGCLNPNGYAVYERFIGEFTAPMMRWVTEVAPITVGSPVFWIYSSYLMILGFAIWNLEPGWRRWSSAILGVGFGGVFAFLAIRNIPLAFMITAPDALSGLARFFRSDSRRAWAAPVLFILILVFFHPWMFSSRLPKEPVPLTQEWMKGACDFIERSRLGGRMYNDYASGGYLIWRLAPKRQVFVDGRGWEYGVELMGRLYTISLKGGFEDLDRVHRFDYVVFQQRQDNRLLYMDKHPDWRCIYFDDGGLIYAHLKRANAGHAARGFEMLKPNEQTFDYLHAYLSDEKTARKTLSEIDRAIRESPPDLSVNAYLLKSYFLQVWKGPQEWAQWMVRQEGRFEHPAWTQQVHAAMRMVK